MEHRYDIFVIGVGSAGYILANKCRKAGRKVAVADSRPLGGTCAMRGCQPKKYLVAAAEIAAISRRMSGIGISPAAKIKWPDLLESKNSFTDPVPERVEESFAGKGVDVFHGTVRFVSPEEVVLDPDIRIRADTFVVATGARPSPLHIQGEEHIITSEQFLDLPAMPERVIFVGGGYISMEFAFVARAAGAEVTVLETLDRPLIHFEQELVQELQEAAKDSGIRIVTGYKVCAVEEENGTYRVSGDENCEVSYRGDLVVHGAGRTAALEALDLDAGNVAYSPGGVLVNDYLQSVSNDRVYAVGDTLAKSVQLSPVADMEAEVAADNILEGNGKKPDYGNVPSVVFTIPPLAGVGMTEAEAEDSGLEFDIKKGSMTSWPSSLRIGQKNAFYKIIMEKGSGRLLGVHILGHNAGETINVFALAMKAGLKPDDLGRVLWAYPTYTSDLKYMID